MTPSTLFEGRAARIALVLHDFAGGGTERIAIRLANCWAAAGRAVTIVAGCEAGPARGLVDSGVAVRVFAPRLSRTIADRLRFGRAAAALVAGADIVVGPGNWHVPALAALRLAGGLATPPVVVKISNPIRRADRGPPGQGLFNRSFARTSRGFAALVALSPALAAEACAVLGRDDIACLAEPNLADDWTPPAPRAATGTIVAAGRLTAQKDFALALDAFAALGGGWRLDLLGDGPERARLESRAAALGIAGRVRFAGHVPDIAPYLAGADALLCSSGYEAYPAVLIEALASGVPVVTTPCSPAIPEIVADPSFGRVAVPTPAALAAALRGVLGGGRPDPAALLAALGKHRLGPAAAAWLGLLDQVAAR